MTAPANPMRIGELLVGTFRFIRAYPAATLGIGALLATVDSVVSGVVLNGVVMQRGGIQGFLSRAGEPLTEATLADLGADLAAALPWLITTLIVSFLVQLAATGIMTMAVVRSRRELAVEPAELWRAVPWGRLLAINAAILALIVFVALIPVATALVLGVPWLLTVAVAGVITVAVAVTTALAVPAAVDEQCGAIAAIRRSVVLVRGGWWHTAAALLVANFLWSTAGSLVAAPVGAIAGGLAGGSRSATGQALSDLLAGITTGAIALPGIAIMTTLIFFARRERSDQ